MKVTFYSNFLNSHQIPFCDEMYKLLGDDFHFVETEPLSDERKNLGFNDDSSKYPYAVRTYISDAEYKKAEDLANISDVVMIGSAPESFVEQRIKDNKHTFRGCERYFKRGKWVLLYPKMFISKWKKDIRFKNKNLYMLCVGGYAAKDCEFIGCYKDKKYKWAYFPILNNFNKDEILNSKSKDNKKIKIIWVARYLFLKHPEVPVKLVKKLVNNGYNIELKMVGDGPKFSKIQNLVKKYGLEDKIIMTGAIPIADVQEEMKKADIFIMTSNQREGWGAVINEAMACGCAVVANEVIGAVPYLIKDGENGFSYKNRSLKDLYIKTEKLINNRDLRLKFGSSAIDTVKGLWSAGNSAKRLKKLFESIIEGNPENYDDGPCSRAE